jgi:hypothetical protein
MVYLLRKLGGPVISRAWLRLLGRYRKKARDPQRPRAGDNQSSNLSAPLCLVKCKSGLSSHRKNNHLRCKCIRIRHLRRHLAKLFSVAKATKAAMLERVPPPNI